MHYHHELANDHRHSSAMQQNSLKHLLSGYTHPRRSSHAHTCSSLSLLDLLSRGLLSLFLGPGPLPLQRTGGRAWALANRKRSPAFRLLQARRRRRRRRWGGVLARRRAVLPLLRRRLPLRWVLARQLFAAKDLGLGQVVYELLDGVRVAAFGDLVQQVVFGIGFLPGFDAVGVFQYAVHCSSYHLRRPSQLTCSGRWEGWKWAEQTWLWSCSSLMGGLEVVSDAVESGSLRCECKRNLYIRRMAVFIKQGDGLPKRLQFPIWF
jgi:hypothetical protein